MDDQLKFNTIPRQGTFGKVVDTANKNFELAKVAIDGLEYATHRNKGLFGTLEALQAKHSSPTEGDWALVGTSFPCSLYRANSSRQWVLSGTYNGDNVALNDYVLKSTYNTDKAAIEGDIEELQHTVYGHSIEQEVEFEHANEGQALATTIPSGAKIFISGDLDTVKGYVSNSETDYQAITNGTIADRNIGLVRCGDSYGTVTITAVVENGLENDVQAIRTDYNNFENKLRGNGSLASAMIYPMLNLGDYTNINDVNTAIDSAFEATNTIKQGRLRLTRNGQIIFVDQFAIDYSQGRWAQMAYGMIAPSSQDEGATLVQATDHPHVVWRMNGVDSGKWHELEGNISLKTINGNSIYGEGDITISEAAQIVVDTTIDPSSDNAVANSAVAAVVAEIYDTFAEAVQQVMDEKGTIICKVWQSDVNWPSPITTPVGTWGYDTTNKELLRVNEAQSWQHYDLSEDVVYVDAVNNKQYRWNGSNMVSIGGGSSVSVVNAVVSGNMNAVSSNAVFQAMRQYAIDEVAVIKCWSDDSQDYDNWHEGDYWYDPIEDELWRCNDQQGSNFEAVVRPIIMLKEPNYDIWVWNTQYAKKVEAETESSISAETAESTNPPTTAAVYNAIHAVQEEVDDINMEDYRKNSDAEDEKLYPEYWYVLGEYDRLVAAEPSTPNAARKAELLEQAETWCAEHPIVYAKNYYDWNKVWYKDDISNSGASGTLNADVIYPTEYLNTALTWVRGLKDTTSTKKKLMTEDVYYDSTLNQFVILFNGTYYAKWNNSYLWNNEEDGVIVSAHHLRNDTVYCRMKQGDYMGRTKGKKDSVTNTQLYVPYYYAVTKVVVNNVLTSIFDTFTNFRDAIARCRNENNGNVYFHSTKIYGYIPTGGDRHRWYNTSDFTINGQGATICAVSRFFIEPEDISDDPTNYPTREVTYPFESDDWARNIDNVLGTVLHMRGCEHFTVKNLKIKAVKNAVKNSASNYVFSFSSGYTFGINAIDCSDINITNVEFAGCSKDIEIKNDQKSVDCTKVVIDGWKSDDSAGIDGGHITSLLITNSQVITNRYAGVHVMYFYGRVHSWTCRNCSFVQDTIFNTNFIQVKQAKAPTSGTWLQRDHVFENCYFRYGRGIIYYTPYNLHNIVFRNCTFMQTESKYNNRICFWGGFRPVSISSAGVAAITLNDPANVFLDKCSISLYGKLIYMKVDAQKTSSGTGAFWKAAGLGSNPDLKPFFIAMRSNYIHFMDTTNISNYAFGGEIFQSTYPNYAIYNEDNVCNMTLPTKNNLRSFDMANIGLIVDETIDKKSLRPVQNKVIESKFKPVDAAIFGDRDDAIQITSELLPKTAEEGTVYYCSDLDKYYKCVCSGVQTKLVVRVKQVDTTKPVIGRLKVFIGISSNGYTSLQPSGSDTEADAQRKKALLDKYCVLNVYLDSTTRKKESEDEEDDSSGEVDPFTGVKDFGIWVLGEINTQYPDFVYSYGENVTKKAAERTESGGYYRFEMMTDGGFDRRKNLLFNSSYVVFEAEEGSDAIDASLYNAANNYQYPALYGSTETGYNSPNLMDETDDPVEGDNGYYYALKKVREVLIGADPTENVTIQTLNSFDPRFADHILDAEEIALLKTYMQYTLASNYTPTGLSTVKPTQYYIYGFDAVWEEITPSDGLLSDMNVVKTRMGRLSNQNHIVYWGSTSSSYSNWAVGDYWYNPSSIPPRLRRCVFANEDRVSFEIINTPAILTRVVSGLSVPLYIWNGTALFEVSSNPVTV